jgi:coenzyme F420 biosynthesis associated uncharacterized protein
VVRPPPGAYFGGGLRRSALAAHPHVAAVTGLSTEPGHGVLVVDRGGWAQVNLRGFRILLEPIVEAAARKQKKEPPARLTGFGSRVVGAELGGLLGLLSSRVLGQYDAFGEQRSLLLNAPTIVTVERDLEVDPDDFRLWVCLHEETHRVQFTYASWLTEHLLAGVRSLADELTLEPGQLAERLVGAARSLPGALRSGDADRPSEGSGAPLLDLLQTPDQRRRLSEITAVMSLLEGHADVVMDDVGPDVVPSVAVIRQRFSRRRAGRGAVDRVLRKLLGLEAKARQYAEGARFVRGVTGQVGMGGFNAVWSSAEALPTPAEIADPPAWVARVHG